MSEPAYIVGGGRSLEGFDFSRLSGRYHVAVNRAFEFCPDAGAIYFMDRGFWVGRPMAHPAFGPACLEHGGRIVRGTWKAESDIDEPRIELHRVPESINSGEGALRWVVEQGWKRIYLLGFDMQPNGHFHSGYEKDQLQARWGAWIEDMDRFRHSLGDFAEVYNASPDSKLECFPKVTLEEALADAVPV